MGGSKKSSTPAIQSGPYSIAEPPVTPLPAFLGGGKSSTFDSMPGQLALIAQQLHTGYPSMPQADILKQLQGIYKPVTTSDPAVAAAVSKAKAAPAPAAGPVRVAGGGILLPDGRISYSQESRGTINSFSQLMDLMQSGRR